MDDTSSSARRDLRLPENFKTVDIADWLTIPPNELIKKHKQVLGSEDQQFLAPDSAAKAIKYGRSSSSQAYDTIAFRTIAACPARGVNPILTRAGMVTPTTATAVADDDGAADTRADDAPTTEETCIKFKKIDGGGLKWGIGKTSSEGPFVGDANGPYRYNDTESEPEITAELPWQIDVFSGEGTMDQDGWMSFSLCAPAQFLAKDSFEADSPRLFTQHARVFLPQMNWLPLPSLINHGRFLPLREWSDELQTETAHSCFYCFLSHRWMSPNHPDPAGSQAALSAWQLVGHLCEAVRVAAARGVMQPRRRLREFFNRPIGISGSDLAEALLVNVLRPAIRTGLPWKLVVEVASLDHLMQDHGIRAALNDIDLHHLKETLTERPLLRRLTERIFVWFDYSCVPQEEEQLLEALQYLSRYQRVGHTAALVDYLDDYLPRAWCAYEAIVSEDQHEGSTKLGLLMGSQRAADYSEKRLTAEDNATLEWVFENVVGDLPHLVWRAVLDTEVLGVQTADECMERLELTATKAEDVRLIYDWIRDFPMPVELRTDNSEIVTGTFPLPVVDGGAAVIIPSNEPSAGLKLRNKLSLDWTAALRIETGWRTTHKVQIPSFISLESSKPTWSFFRRSVPSCHVAIIGSCEGEAIMLANWVLSRREELETLLNTKVCTLSWLASDVAPVGSFAEGKLQGRAIDGATWVIVTTALRFKGHYTTQQLIETLAHSGREIICLSIDETEENIAIHTAFAETKNEVTRRIPLVDTTLPEHIGGLYRGAIPALLAQP